MGISGNDFTSRWFQPRGITHASRCKYIKRSHQNYKIKHNTSLMRSSRLDTTTHTPPRTNLPRPPPCQWTWQSASTWHCMNTEIHITPGEWDTSSILAVSLRWEWQKYFTYFFSLHESVSLLKLFWSSLAVFSWSLQKPRCRSISQCSRHVMPNTSHNKTRPRVS